MDTITVNETFKVKESSWSDGGVREAVTITMAVISLAINVFLIYILPIGKGASKIKTTVYYIIANISYLLIALLVTDVGFIAISYVNNNKAFLILYDTHNHLLLALYSLMIMFSFFNCPAWFRHSMKILWTITISMILYSIALIMCNDELIYSFMFLRAAALSALLIILAIKVIGYFRRTCVRVGTEMLQIVLILSFLCSWLPDFLFNIFHVNTFDLSVIYCIGVIACASNVIFNVILIIIVDEEFRANLTTQLGTCKRSREYDVVKVAITI